tara:strand:+ start:88 stop:192 length:105 start_codon:yes stop_codon:yes gene_type:complete
MKPKEVYNPVPEWLDLEQGDGTMPLIFNRTETNQ